MVDGGGGECVNYGKQQMPLRQRTHCLAGQERKHHSKIRAMFWLVQDVADTFCAVWTLRIDL